MQWFLLCKASGMFVTHLSLSRQYPPWCRIKRSTAVALGTENRKSQIPIIGVVRPRFVSLIVVLLFCPICSIFPSQIEKKKTTNNPKRSWCILIIIRILKILSYYICKYRHIYLVKEAAKYQISITDIFFLSLFSR